MTNSTPNTTPNPDVILSYDNTPLKTKLQQSNRRAQLLFFGLTLPLLAFIIISFIYPLVNMAHQSFYNPHVAKTLPKTLERLEQWDIKTPVPDDVYKIYLDEIKTRERFAVGKVASQVNYIAPGSKRAILRSLRVLRKYKDDADPRALLLKADKKWGQPELWANIRLAGQPYSINNYLVAFDFEIKPDGNIEARDADKRVYFPILQRTIVLSLGITLLCLLMGYPIAYQIANLPARKANLLIILVLLPFWTSILVRTSAWIVLLQGQGTVNDILVYLGLINDDNRLELIFNMTGTVIAMVHVLLPFMVLPLYSVLKGIDPSYMRAAESMGATRWHAFRTVYFPQSLPGVGAGCILVFILSVGFYITPALVGGTSGTLISNFINHHIQDSLNWGLAAALSTVLLIVVLGVYYIYNRLVGVNPIKVR